MKKVVTAMMQALPKVEGKREVVMEGALEHPQVRRELTKAGVLQGISTSSVTAAKARAFDNIVDGIKDHVVVEQKVTLVGSKRKRMKKTVDKSAEQTIMTMIRGDNSQRGDIRKLHQQTGWHFRKLSHGVRRRKQIEEGKAGVSFSSVARRAGRSIIKEHLRHAYEFYLEPSNSKTAPGRRDQLWIRDPDSGTRVRVKKQFMERSQTEIFLDFKKQFPHVKMGERTFRKCKPLECKRLTEKHRNVCACRS